MSKEELIAFAKQFAFEIEFERPAYRLVRFKRDHIRLDVWMSGTVGVYENGNQRFVKGLSWEDIKEFIVNL